MPPQNVERILCITTQVCGLALGVRVWLGENDKGSSFSGAGFGVQGPQVWKLDTIQLGVLRDAFIKEI